MEEKFKYRKHIKYVRNFTAIVLCFMVVMIFLICLIARLPAQGIMPLTIVTFILLGEMLFIWILMSRFMKVRITLNENGLIYKNCKDTYRINYSDITKVGFSAIKYTGGWMKIESPVKNIRLTVVVANIQRLILLLKKQLDEHQLSELYDAKKMFNFLKTAAFSDESWLRVYQYWWKILLITFGLTALSIVISLLSGFSFARSFFFCFLTYLLPLVLYLFAEFIFGRRIAKLSNLESFSVPDRDIEFENSVFRKALNWGMVAYIVLLILTYII